MANFIPFDYNQSTMVVINFNDQIQTGTFEHAVHHLVDNKLDLSLFEQVYKNDDNGRPAYDPAMCSWLMRLDQYPLRSLSFTFYLLFNIA